MKQIEEPPFNRKRVLMFLVALVLILIVGGWFFKSQFLDSRFQKAQGQSTSLQTSQSDNFNKMSADISGQFQTKLDSVKSEANGLNATDVASSSPQVQKVINDIKALEGYPTSQIKSTCEKICDGL